jgi:hypothetical protein
MLELPPQAASSDDQAKQRTRRPTPLRGTEGFQPALMPRIKAQSGDRYQRFSAGRSSLGGITKSADRLIFPRAFAHKTKLSRVASDARMA